MKHLLVIVYLCFAVNGWSQSATQLVIKVELPDGSPAKRVRIQLLQLERSVTRNFLCGTTDNRGEFTIHFESETSKDEKHYGWGIYRFVLMPEDLRWELSDIFYWNAYSPSNELKTGIAPEDHYRDIFQERTTNWSVGNLTRVQEGKSQIWRVTLRRGEDIQVSVVDQVGKVLPRSNFRVFLDTNMLSHTGSGGEIPMFSAKSDENGKFVVPHAADFCYSFEYECPVVSTDQCEYCSAVTPYFTTVVTNKVNGKSAIVVYHKRIPHSVSISVIDKVTKLPIAGAAINVIMDFGSAAMGGPPIGRTDSNGHFKTDRLFTEHVLSLRAYKEGYGDNQFEMKDFRPGATYVFELQKK